MATKKPTNLKVKKTTADKVKGGFAGGAAAVVRRDISHRERCRQGLRSTPPMGVVVSSRRRRDPLSQALGITLPPPFRQSVEDVRLTLDGRERALFNLLCVAGHLGRSLPNSIGNRRTTWGARDPREKLARVAARMESGSTSESGRRPSARLVRSLVRKLRPRESEDAYRLLRVLAWKCLDRIGT